MNKMAHIRSLISAGVLVGIMSWVAPALVNGVDEAAATTLVSLAERVQPIFDTHCVVCHQTGVEQAGLNLEDGDAHMNLVNVKSTQSQLPRIVPGKPAESYLARKILGTHAEVGGTGVRMPLSSSGNGAMSVDEEDTIVTWIEQGALDN